MNFDWSHFRTSLKRRFIDPDMPRAFPWTDKDKRDENDMTWEEYHEQLRKKHPIKCFVFDDIPSFIGRKVVYPLDNFSYYIRSHITQNYKLDLRQPVDSVEKYRYGYLDGDTVLLYACFNSLVKFVKDKKKNKYVYDIDSIEEMEKELEEMHEDLKSSFKSQIDALKEQKAIYEYWTIGRSENYKEHERLINDWNNDRDNKEKLNKINEYEKFMYDEDNEYLHRLINIRSSLWI